MNKLSFFGMQYLLLRPEAGHTTCKFNRAAKIARNAKNLVRKFDRFIDTTQTTLRNQCALAVKLMMFTGIRVGNEESANGYMTKPHPMQKDQKAEFRQTFGLTTLLRKHVKVRGQYVVLEFVGKKGVQQKITIRDKKLVKQCKMQLIRTNDDQFLTVSDADVRQFVKKSVGWSYKAKDFRTMYANTVATQEVLSVIRRDLPQRKKDFRAEQKSICENVAAKLGNTPGISKRAYIDPAILQLHEQLRWG